MTIDKTKVLIYGSCVSRDIFRFRPNNFDITDYYARSSLVSLVEAPLDISPEDIRLESKFQKRMVMSDLKKDLYSRLRRDDYDVLLMDFIDERLNIIDLGNTRITKSKELVNSGFINKFDRVIEIDRLEMDIKLWEKACDEFFSRIIKCVDPRRIILLEAFWAEKYIGKKGLFYSFPKNSISNISLHNNLLRSYYSYFKNTFKKCQVISSGVAIANESHLWGLSPFHFVSSWYEDMAIKIQEVANQVKNGGIRN